MKSRFLALFYALSVYLLLAGAGWMLLSRWTQVTEKAQSTTVTLVRPDEVKTEAKQAVNSKASHASRVQEEPPKPEFLQKELEPVKKTALKRTHPKEKPSKKQEAPRPAPVEAKKVLALKEPAPRAVTLPTREQAPKLKPADPFDSRLVKALKRPLSESELASCCLSEPRKAPPKKMKTRRAKRLHKYKHRNTQRPSRESVRSRARRGGSMSANRFLAKIKRRIARNKRYPSSARRRRLQGTVRVSFTVLPSGRVGSISVRGPQIFTASARQAVRRAFPVDVSGVGFSLPRRISVTLRYRLR